MTALPCTCDEIYEADTGRWTLAHIDPLCPQHGDPRDTSIAIPFSLKDGTTEGMERLIAAIREEPEVDG